jgi:hypothetical protein
MELKGYGLLQPGDRQRTLTNAEIGHKNVSFLVLRDRWSFLEPTKGKYNFDYLLGQMERCIKFNKPFTVSIMTGDDCNPIYLPKKQPWSTIITARYELLHHELRLAMQARGINFTKIAGIWLTGPTIPSQEMHLKHSGGVDATKFPGYMPSKMQNAWSDSISCISRVWGDVATQFILSISGQTPVYKSYLDSVIEKAINTLGQNSVAFQHNSLGTQTSLGSNHHKKLLQLHSRGLRVGAEMVQPGHTAAIPNFPEADFIVLYPQDIIKKLPKI